jgi:hypothetical protein
MGTNVSLVVRPVTCWFLVRLTFDPEGGHMFLRKFDSYEIHSVIFQKMATFITTAARTSNPTTGFSQFFVYLELVLADVQ